MVTKNLNDFVRGWLIGNFDPSLVKTGDFEIGIKRYIKGDTEASHYHKECIEWTIVIVGKVRMNDKIYVKDDVVEVDKMENIEFECIEDATTLVIKSPHIKGDKYFV